MLNCVSLAMQDHCGALPYMTEMVGYKGPIYMTHPTKAIAPILLEDMRKVAVERKGETNFFTSAMIRECMKKVVAVNLHQVSDRNDSLEDFFLFDVSVFETIFSEILLFKKPCSCDGKWRCRSNQQLNNLKNLL